MPLSSFLAVEIIAFLAAGAVGYEAWKAGAAKLTTLFVGMGFGFAIELFFTTVYSGYSYGDFLVDITIKGHSIPLWVAVGWGTIIYISMAASDRMQVPWYARAPLDGLLAVSIDFSLDPIAEALGWWHWTRPGLFFGIPFDNFIGWMLIVSSFSFAARMGFHFFPAGTRTWRDILIPIVAVIPSVAVVVGAQVLLDKIYPLIGEPLTFFILASVLVALSVWMTRSAVSLDFPPWFLTVVPGGYHGLMLILLLVTGESSRNPALLLVLPLAAISSLFAFRFPRHTHAIL